MGKDSLLKATSKKKSPARKKAGDKAVASSKKASAKGNPGAAAAKKGAKKKTAGKTVAAEPAVTLKKSVPKTAPPAAAPEISIRDLLREKFAVYAPAAPFKPKVEQRKALTPSPPFISAADPAEASRLKALLLEKLDLEAMAAAARSAVPAAAPSAAPPETQAQDTSAAASSEAQPEAEPQETSTTAPSEVPPEAHEASAAAPPETPPEAEELPAAADAPCAPRNAPPHVPPDRNVLEGFGGPEPLSRTAIMGIVAFAMLVLLIVAASYSNSHKYYLKAADGGLEIWQGAFAPMGRQLLVALPGVAVPETMADAYGKDEVYPLAYDYFVGQADRLLEAPGLPDFESIKAYLAEAGQFASTPDAQRMIRIRTDYIDLFILRYKAEVAAAKATVDGLEAAVGYLREAERLSADEAESVEIAKRIEQFSAQSAQLAEVARQAEIEAAKAEETKTAAVSAPEQGAGAPPADDDGGQAGGHGETTDPGEAAE